MQTNHPGHTSNGTGDGRRAVSGQGDRELLLVSDFDGTLTTADTLPAFMRYALGPVRTAWAFLRCSPWIGLMLLGLYDNGKAKQRLFGTGFRGMPYTEFQQLGKDFAKSHRHLLRPLGMKAVGQALGRQARVVVVSASVEEWIRPFFSEDVTVLGTQAETRDGRLTGRFLTPNCYGPEKVKRLQAAVPDRSSCLLLACGDSRGDRELLAYADKGYLRPFEEGAPADAEELFTLLETTSHQD